MTAPSISAIREELLASGAKPLHVSQVLRAWAGLAPWEPSGNAHYPKALVPRVQALRERLAQVAEATAVRSASGESVKFIVRLSDGRCVETVLLPRQAVCVSTQVGCAVGCLFCMTGRGGLVRQLASTEIVAQVLAARAERPDLKKVVLMGMGEPSHNMHAVREAVEFLGTVMGFAHKELVVSSVGDRRLFEAMPAWQVRPAFALSLHTTDEAKRRTLLPRSAPVPVEELLERTLGYARLTKYPAQIEWTLIAGLNDSPAEVERLAQLLDPRWSMVNFIAVNPVPGAAFERPSNARMQDLITILRSRGIVATVRDSAAQDIEGGCGQLRARYLGIAPES
ncbi:MAG: radical SAM protein [Duodenibacillus sp.]|nr:radical SAM protein [Duodenibacillus sp.]